MTEQNSATNPATEVATPPVADGQIPVTDEPAPALSEGEQTPPADETEEIDYEGHKVRVPRVVKDAILRHQDYTRKTQEIADTRRTLEQREQSFAQHEQVRQAFMEDYGKLIAVDQQLEAFRQVDWNKLNADDPLQAQQLFQRYTFLKDARTDLNNTLAMKQREASDKQRTEFARHVETSRAALPREIPGWNAELEAKLTDLATQYAGYRKDEVKTAFDTDPRAAKMLHLAWIGYQSIQKQRADAKAIAAAPAPEPVPQVGTSRAPATQGLTDRLSTDEWIKRRDREARKRN